MQAQNDIKQHFDHSHGFSSRQPASELCRPKTLKSATRNLLASPCVVLVLSLASSFVYSAHNPPLPAHPGSPSTDANADRLAASDLAALSELLTQLGRTHIPNRFVEDKDWGETKERWDGLHVQLKGLQLKTKRRKKEVNHGTWKRYEVELLDPDREFDVTIRQLNRLPDGRLALVLEIQSAVKVHARLSRWNRGVQVISVSADSRAKLQLTVQANMDVQVDFKHLPPDVVFAPQIESATIDLVDFEVDRVSKIGGDVAEQLGKGARGILEKKIAEKQQKITDKLNRSIEKRKDDLRLSVHDLVASQWGDLASKYLDLPASEQPSSPGNE